MLESVNPVQHELQTSILSKVCQPTHENILRHCANCPGLIPENIVCLKYKCGVIQLADMGFDLVLKFFPTELWDTIDPSRAKKNGAMPRPKRKQNVGVDETEEVVEEEEGGPKPGDDEDAEEAKKGDDDEQPEEENPDETFSEDDDEMAGDYNGEQYFDNGDEDDNDGGGGGDGDDDGYD